MKYLNESVYGNGMNNPMASINSQGTTSAATFNKTRSKLNYQYFQNKSNKKYVKKAVPVV